jgi:hypothetical protein
MRSEVRLDKLNSTGAVANDVLDGVIELSKATETEKRAEQRHRSQVSRQL